MSSQRRKSLIGAALVAICVISTGLAQQATKPVVAGRLVETKLSAPSLKGNLLGDPVEQSVAIYLPPSYDTSPTRRFPTLYLLHGFTGTHKGWTGYLRLPSLLDQMIKDRQTGEFIVIMPNGWNAYKGAFYSNSPVTGNWEDYIYRDLVAHVDANYRTLSRPESRGIAGHSMGGYGAMTLAMKHPDVFSAVYALSPCCFAMEGDFTAENKAWLKTVRITKKEQLKQIPTSAEEFYQLAFVAVSAALSPNPDRGPFFVDFPYVERDGRLEKNESVFARWQEKMPVYMVEDKKENLLKLRGIFIDYGQKEEFSHIRIATQQFSKALSERSIPHLFEIYEGGNHNNKIRQRLETRLFRFFTETLDFPTTAAP
jgi:S-formylglutathione hydrolase